MCPQFPIPSAYVETGSGPGQIPRRDPGNGSIAGAPTIFTRTLVDEVAELTRRQTPSGFVGPDTCRVLGPAGPLQVSVNVHGEVVVDGYRLALADGPTTLQLLVPPNAIGATRDDLILFEAWFDAATAQSRVLNWRLRMVPGVDFTTYPDGVSDPKVTAVDGRGIDTLATYQKFHPNFDRQADAGLFLATRPGQEHDILTERGHDGQFYQLAYALPVARIRRLNTQAYEPLSNPNGAPSVFAGQPSPRPDGLYSDMVEPAHQLVDLRSQVSFAQLDLPRMHRRATLDYLMGRLKPNGVSREVVAVLGDSGQQAYFGDPAAMATFTVSTNIVRHSHFEADGGSGLAQGWSPYTTGTTIGQLIYGAPGQVIERTADDGPDAYGIQQALTGFAGTSYRVQVGYLVAWSNPDCKLIIEGVRSDNSLAFQTVTDISLVTPGTYLELNNTFTPAVPADHALTLHAYLRDSGGRVTLTHIDVRTNTLVTPLMPVTDGTRYTVTQAAALTALGASFDPTGVLVYDGVTGDLLTATCTLSNATTLQVQLAAATPTRDLKITVPVVYPSGAGFPDLFAAPDKAWDADGFVGLAYAGTTVSPMPEPQVGQTLVSGETVQAYSPALAHKGVTTTMTIPGNGTGTYTVPATRYGRSALLPIAVTVNGSPQILSTLTRNTDGSLTFTLGNGATVASSSNFTLELALDMPLLVWDDRQNGIVGAYKATRIATSAAAGGNTVVLPLPATALALVDSQACMGVFVNGQSVTLAQGATVTGIGTPVLTVQLPFLVAAGDVVEVAVLLREAIESGRGTAIAYPGTRAPDAVGVPAGPMLVLTDPELLAHTKGTAGADLAGDFGPRPFTRDPGLDGRAIGLLGQTVLRSVVLDIPKVANTLTGEPLLAGRRLPNTNLAGLVVEGTPLGTASPHRTVLTFLASLRGRVVLVVVEAARSDARNLIDGSAVVRLLDLDGRPLILA